MLQDDGDSEVVVPPTIQALLQARLDQLGGDERSVIERGAVEGEVFHRLPVAELASEQVRLGLDGHLAKLIRNELIRPETATMPGDDAFRFRHLLIRDAAYDSLPKETRADLHERFALWIDEHVQLVEQDEIVGYHLEQAVLYRRELGREDDALAGQAARRLGAAGRGALGRGDNSAAVRLLERADDAPLPRPRRGRLEFVMDLVLALMESARFDDCRGVDRRAGNGRGRAPEHLRDGAGPDGGPHERHGLARVRSRRARPVGRDVRTPRGRAGARAGSDGPGPCRVDGLPRRRGRRAVSRRDPARGEGQDSRHSSTRRSGTCARSRCSARRPWTPQRPRSARL